MNEQIVAAAERAIRGEIPVPKSPGLCLALVRMIVENGCFGGRWAFYERYLVTRTSQGGSSRSDWSPWAADLEASMKQLGFQVPLAERKPGDLIFNHNAARPYGHVGIYLMSPSGRELVLENIRDEYRPHSQHLGRFLSLTPLEHFRRTLLARLQPR